MTKNKIGTLYFNLDTRKRQKVFFGVIFFIQRCLLVLLVAVNYNFAMQWQLCHTVLLLNTVYILQIEPYLDHQNRALDIINVLFLLALSLLMVTSSAWNTNSINRFNYGIMFDILVVL